MSRKQDLIFYITARRFDRGATKAECLAGRAKLGRLTVSELERLVAGDDDTLSATSHPHELQGAKGEQV